MKNKQLTVLFRCALVLIALCGIAVCAFWYPKDGAAVIAAKGGVVGWIYQIFLWLTALPCFVMLFFGWKFSESMERESVFTHATAQYLKISFKILIVDLAVFIVGNIFFLAFQCSNYGWLYLLVAVVGYAIAAIIYTLFYYVSRAAVLQEESEGTV
jgi:hypothetical protein